jgi:hypothetical protein
MDLHIYKEEDIELLNQYTSETYIQIWLRSIFITLSNLPDDDTNVYVAPVPFSDSQTIAEHKEKEKKKKKDEKIINIISVPLISIAPVIYSEFEVFGFYVKLIAPDYSKKTEPTLKDKIFFENDNKIQYIKFQKLNPITKEVISRLNSFEINCKSPARKQQKKQLDKDTVQNMFNQMGYELEEKYLSKLLENLNFIGTEKKNE